MSTIIEALQTLYAVSYMYRGMKVSWADKHEDALARADRALEAHQARLAVPQGYYFHRFVAGTKMAEDVEVLKAKSLDEAVSVAARICPKSPMTVLVLAAAPTPEASQPTQAEVPEVVANFRTESDGLIGTTSAKVHSVSWADDGALVVEIDHWPRPPRPPSPEQVERDREDAKLLDWLSKTNWYVGPEYGPDEGYSNANCGDLRGELRAAREAKKGKKHE